MIIPSIYLDTPSVVHFKIRDTDKTVTADWKVNALSDKTALATHKTAHYLKSEPRYVQGIKW